MVSPRLPSHGHACILTCSTLGVKLRACHTYSTTQSTVDVFRLNFSHGGYAEHRERVDVIRGAAGDAGRHVAILQVRVEKVCGSVHGNNACLVHVQMRPNLYSNRIYVVPRFAPPPTRTMLLSSLLQAPSAPLSGTHNRAEWGE